MGRSPQILWPHNSPSKSCCPDPRMGRRILTFSDLHHGWLSIVSLWALGFLRLPMTRSWCFRHTRRIVMNAFFLGIMQIASVFGRSIQWHLYEAARIWKLKVPLGIGWNLSCLTFLLWALCAVSSPRFRLLYKAPWEGHLPHPPTLELCKSSKSFHFPWTTKKKKKRCCLNHGRCSWGKESRG